MLWIKDVLGRGFYALKNWGKSTSMLESGPLPGQLEVIGKLDALAKSLRSSEAWKCLFVCFSCWNNSRRFTLPETNIAPEKLWLGNYFPFGKPYFQVRKC